MARQTPFPSIIAGPDAVLRRPARSSRGVGPGRASARPATSAGFQLSQRADYIEVEVGLETTLKRGIINTRDEPHADADKYRRLHVIIGDANLGRDVHLPQGRHHRAGARPDRGGRPDLADLRAGPSRCTPCTVISHDPSLRADGRAGRRPRADRPCAAADLPRAGGQATSKQLGDRRSTRATARSLETWAHGARPARARPDGVRGAASTGRPSCGCWRASAARESLSWAAPRLHLVDLQYSDVRLDKGLYNRLVARGSMKRLVTEQQVLDAMTTRRPTPAPTSAATACERYGADIAAASAGTR